MCNENCDYDCSCCHCHRVEKCCDGKVGNAECHPKDMNCQGERVEKMKKLFKQNNLDFPSIKRDKRPRGIAGLHN